MDNQIKKMSKIKFFKISTINKKSLKIIKNFSIYIKSMNNKKKRIQKFKIQTINKFLKHKG